MYITCTSYIYEIKKLLLKLISLHDLHTIKKSKYIFDENVFENYSHKHDEWQVWNINKNSTNNMLDY